MATRVVGLDIGTFAVRAAEMTVGGGQPTLQRFAQVALPPGAVRDGEIVDAPAVSAAIRRLWSDGGFKTKRVVVGIMNQRVIVRQADLPAMSEQDLRSALRFEAQELIPIPVEDAVLDFQILDESLDEHSERRMRILLAAAQRDMIRTHLAAVEGAGLAASAVDVIPFALVRALTVGGPSFDADGAEAIVCIGGGVTNVVVHEGGIPRFVRGLLVGGDDITEAIARELDIDVDTAEDLKRRADATSTDASVARAAQVVTDRLAPLVEEIRGSLDYYLAQAQSAPISRVLVTGGGSRLPGIMERLQSQLGGRVEPARPLAKVAVGQLRYSEAELADLEPLLAVPIGLALAGEQIKGVRRISLLPQEVAVVREQRRQALVGGGVAAALAAALIILAIVKAGQASDEGHKADDADANVARLRAQAAKLQDNTTLASDISVRQNQVRSVLANDIAWTRLFQEVATVLPSDVWITSFTGQSAATGPTLNLAMKGFDHTSTARWLLRSADLKDLSGVWVPSSTKTGLGSQSLVTFNSQANLTASAHSDRLQQFLDQLQQQGGAK